MKLKHILLLCPVICSLLACKGPGDQKEDDTKDNPTPSAPAITVPDFACGADVSWVSEMEKGGKTFNKQDGTPADIFDVLKDVGINSIRLRVWVNPTGGWSGKEDCTALAKRAAAAGMPVMIDFHYSDFFADPSRQDFPKDWSADKSDLMKTIAHVKEHTADVLEGLKAAGVTPAWIQIGNETRNGFLWPLGQLWSSGGSTPGDWASFVQLYNSGYSAAKAVFPTALVMPHLNNAYDDNGWWFKDFKSNGGKFDAIALSHYPQTNSKMSPEQMNTAAVSRIKALAATYGVPVIVSEVGVKVASEAASAKLLQEFMDSIRTVPSCKGVFYWEPEIYGGWKPSIYNSLGWNSYDMGAFTNDGRPSAIMNAFK